MALRADSVLLDGLNATEWTITTDLWNRLLQVHSARRTPDAGRILVFPRSVRDSSSAQVTVIRLERLLMVRVFG
jgi:hypothetical protein